MISDSLKPGLRHAETIEVRKNLTSPALARVYSGFSELPASFATGFLIGLVEWTCIEALRPHLKAGQRSVGIHVDLSHSEATPCGRSVTAEISLIRVIGHKLRFKVICRDGAEIVSEGYHDRVIVDFARFKKRLEDKRAESAAGRRYANRGIKSLIRRLDTRAFLGRQRRRLDRVLIRPRETDSRPPE